MQNNIENFFQHNLKILPKRLAVAVSGGIDSLVLTFLLQEFCLKNNIKLFAITVDHKMRKSSSTEALQLQKILEKNKISHQILEMNAKKLPKSNIEANLREARYELLYSFCTKNKIEHLFLGHHLGDVAENFLIRLFRGSQLDGLSVMPEMSQHKKIKLCRPLLNTPKDELEKFLKARKIKWFEDETNQDEKFLRNKIRKFFDSFEEKNLIQKRIKNAAEIIKESKDFIDDILLREAATCLTFLPEGSFIINLNNYQKIPQKIALKILSLTLIETSGNPYKPRLESLKNFEKNILTLEKGKKKNFYGCMARLLNKSEMPSAKSEKLLLIYRDIKEAQNPTQNFDDKTTIIDGRFLQKNNSKKPCKFYFRTILKEVFEDA